MSCASRPCSCTLATKSSSVSARTVTPQSHVTVRAIINLHWSDPLWVATDVTAPLLQCRCRWSPVQDLVENGLGDRRWLDAEVACQGLLAASEGAHGLAAVARSCLRAHQPLIADLAVGLERDRLLGVACCQQGIPGLDPDLGQRVQRADVDVTQLGPPPLHPGPVLPRQERPPRVHARHQRPAAGLAGPPGTQQSLRPMDAVRGRLDIHPAAAWEVEVVAAKSGPDERRTVEADPGHGGPQAADECAQVDVPGGRRPVLPEHVGKFLTRDTPAALAYQVGQRHPPLATSELGLEEQPATGLQAQPAGDVDADAHSQSETDLYRRAQRIYGRDACLPRVDEARRARGRAGCHRRRCFTTTQRAPEAAPAPDLLQAGIYRSTTAPWAPRHTISRPGFCASRLRTLRVRALRCSAPDHDLAHLATNSLAANRWIPAKRSFNASQPDQVWPADITDVVLLSAPPQRRLGGELTSAATNHRRRWPCSRAARGKVAQRHQFRRIHRFRHRPGRVAQCIDHRARALAA